MKPMHPEDRMHIESLVSNASDEEIQQAIEEAKADIIMLNLRIMKLSMHHESLHLDQVLLLANLKTQLKASQATLQVFEDELETRKKGV